MSQDFSAVKIHLQPLPIMDRRLHAAQRKNIVLCNAPLVGESGPLLERALLLDVAGVAQHQRYLAQVMAQAEPVPALKQICRNAADHYHAIYVAADRLLNQKYYKHNA